MASPCHSPCSMTIVPPGVREAQPDAAQHPHDVEAVLAAVERRRRVEEPHLRIARDRGIRNIRRVGDDDRDRPVELGEGVLEVDEGERGVVGADAREVLLRPDEGVDRVLGREHARVRHLGGERQGDRAAAGAEIDRDGAGGCRGPQRVDRQLRDHLGLGARHEHPGADAQLEVAEGRDAGDVLQGLARRAARDERRRALGARPSSSASPRTAAACTAPRPSAEDVAGEQLGIDAADRARRRARGSAARRSTSARAAGRIG